MDVNARHRPRKCASTHVRGPVRTDATTHGHSHHWCSLLPHPVCSTHLWNNRFSWHCIETFLALLFVLLIVYDGDNIGFRQKRWPALMRTTRRSARSKTCWQRLHRSMWSASFAMRSSRKVASGSASGCSNARRWTQGAALNSLQRLMQKNPDMEAKVERCISSDMDKFKCIGLSLRTEDSNQCSLVQRNETVECITTMVKFRLVKRISVVLMLDKESFLAYQKQWYGCSPKEEKAKWTWALASPHVHREKVDGVMQVAVKKPHRDSSRAQHRALTCNVDKMTAKQLLSDLSPTPLARILQDSELLRWRRGVLLPQASAPAATLRRAMTMDCAGP